MIFKIRYTGQRVKYERDYSSLVYDGENHKTSSSGGKLWLLWTHVNTRWCYCNGNPQIGRQCAPVNLYCFIVNQFILHWVLS